MTTKFKHTEIRIQPCEVQENVFLFCENCNATYKTANMFLVFGKIGSINTIKCYCDKHIAEHLEEYVKELIKGE
jgi:hypothetical protein